MHRQYLCMEMGKMVSRNDFIISSKKHVVGSHQPFLTETFYMFKFSLLLIYIYIFIYLYILHAYVCLNI